ncbi:hypothetical protein M408DRAFT_193627 [Serendipita vermifera MAFF 305830]|uniref:F-box domain-containing protein n=1 Tax=Serendipita vermifera MAFF 305830 TaxID=933852 RepID=A0A0C3APH7_SERVB|nr:hypothetical protein M408DRAFT_193627 [Serendipita vermifera MAFF 305830]
MDILQKLPNELIVHILSLSTARDILSCAACCHRLKELVSGSSELQFIIELAVQGLRLRNYPVTSFHLDDKSSTVKVPSAIKQIEIFKKSITARQALHPFTMASIPLERYEYEICDGLFGHALKDQENRFRGLEFQKLWIEEGQDECPPWRRYNDLGIDLADFSFDLAEDLLVLVEDPPFNLNMHTKIPKSVFIFTLSESTPHPLARSGYLQSPGEEPWYQCDIKICGPILAILFAFPHQIAHDHGRLSIWNWKTGEIIHTSGSVGGYAFLSQTIILVLLLAEDEENEDQPITQGEMRLEIIQLHENNEPSTFPDRLVLSLPLSTTPDGVYVFSDKPLSDSPNLLPDIRTTPYTLDETSERIIVLQFLTWNHYVFLSTRHLLRLFDSHSGSLLQPIPWDDWGPDGTFWMSGPHLQCGYTSVLGAKFCAISGYKRLFHTDSEGNIVRDEMDTTRCEDGDNARMLLLDFNKRPILRARGKSSSDEGEKEAVVDVGVVHDGTDEDDWVEEDDPKIEKAVVDVGEGAEVHDGTDEDDWVDEEDPKIARFRRRLGRIEVESGSAAHLFGMSSGGVPGEWACFSSHTEGMVLSRLPFRAFQREDVQGYLDWIVGMDHIVGISKETKHTYDVMQFTQGW